ncbi:hypothetical protein EVAR_61632_1 [Eumeta japonica]|uniref:Uncharacterized protein n=1 Tax=Eumeta variegata TaxID=151549 RepID=A0A4C1Z745_EUMVA|nr:hypothetical protein EVAR_61632_1 [Eumeta japonica]
MAARIQFRVAGGQGPHTSGPVGTGPIFVMIIRQKLTPGGGHDHHYTPPHSFPIYPWQDERSRTGRTRRAMNPSPRFADNFDVPSREKIGNLSSEFFGKPVGIGYLTGLKLEIQISDIHLAASSSDFCQPRTPLYQRYRPTIVVTPSTLGPYHRRLPDSIICYRILIGERYLGHLPSSAHFLFRLISYSNSQKPGKAATTPLALRVSTGGSDDLLFDSSACPQSGLAHRERADKSSACRVISNNRCTRGGRVEIASYLEAYIQTHHAFLSQILTVDDSLDRKVSDMPAIGAASPASRRALISKAES